MLKGFLSGRLTAAPVLKSTSNGKQVCQLRVAYSYPRGIDRTGFVDVEIWGPVAKANAENLVAGQQVTVDGNFSFSQWDKDGESRSKLVLVSQDIVWGPKPKAFWDNQSTEAPSPDPVAA